VRLYAAALLDAVISANALITDAVPAAAPTLLALVVVAGIVLGSQGNLAMAALAFVMWLATFLIDRMGVIPPSPIPPLPQLPSLLR